MRGISSRKHLVVRKLFRVCSPKVQGFKIQLKIDWLSVYYPCFLSNIGFCTEGDKNLFVKILKFGGAFIFMASGCKQEDQCPENQMIKNLN
jgi:hypothetical protein